MSTDPTPDTPVHDHRFEELTVERKLDLVAQATAKVIFLIQDVHDSFVALLEDLGERGVIDANVYLLPKEEQEPTSV